MNVHVIDIIVAYLTLRDSLDGRWSIVVKKKSSNGLPQFSISINASCFMTA